MKRSLSFLIYLMLAALLYAPLVNSSQLFFEVKNSVITTQTTTSALTNLTTLGWTNIATFPASAWQPGSLTSGYGPQTITLRNSQNDTISFAVDMKGLIYEIGLGANMVAASSIGAPWTYDTTAIGTSANSAYIVTGSGFAATMIKQTSNTNATPFTLVKPVFTFNSNDLITATTGKSTGRYSGTLMLTARYRVQYANSTEVTYQNITIPFQVLLLIKAATRLSTIEVEPGGGTFTPKYGNNGNYISGTTRFNIHATGDMPRGISMRFLEPNRNFALNPINLPEGVTLMRSAASIPYNLSCENANCNVNGGQVSRVVENGHYVGSDNSVIITPTTGNSLQFDFSLMADFASDFVPAGQYRDTFVVMFEVVL